MVVDSVEFLEALLIEAQWQALFPTFHWYAPNQNCLNTYCLCRCLFLAAYCTIEANNTIKLYAHFSVCLHFPAATEPSCFFFWRYCVSCFLISCFVCLCSFCLTSLHTPHTHLPSASWAPHWTPHCCSAASQRLLLWSPSSRLTVGKALQGYSQLPLLLLLMTR